MANSLPLIIDGSLLHIVVINGVQCSSPCAAAPRYFNYISNFRDRI